MSAQHHEVRGFAWPLGGLHRVLDVRVEQASVDVAQLQLRVRAQDRQLHATAATASAQAATLRTALARQLDAGAHAHALQYLVALAARAKDQDRQRRALESRLALARTRFAALQVRLACVQEARDKAWRAFASGRQRLEGKEADLSWLGERQRRIAAAQRRDGGGA